MPSKPRIPEVVVIEPEFHAYKDHVAMIFFLGKSSFGVRFYSPEHLLTIFQQLMEKAVIVWPDDEWVKQYKED